VRSATRRARDPCFPWPRLPANRRSGS